MTTFSSAVSALGFGLRRTLRHGLRAVALLVALAPGGLAASGGGGGGGRGFGTIAIGPAPKTDTTAEKADTPVVIGQTFSLGCGGGRPINDGVVTYGDGLSYGRTTGSLPQVTMGTFTVKQGLDREVVRRVTRRAIAKIRYCYEVALRDDDELSGEMSVRLLIGPTGATFSAEASGLKPEVDGCVSRALGALLFPAPKGYDFVEAETTIRLRPPPGP
jgi:hypothetical protein